MECKFLELILRIANILEKDINFSMNVYSGWIIATDLTEKDVQKLKNQGVDVWTIRLDGGEEIISN